VKNANKKMLVAISALTLSSMVSAQLEEVLVSAQKREQSLQDVPIAISAVNEELLEKTGINTITEVIPMVPGLTGAERPAGDIIRPQCRRGCGESDHQ
jgi:iron complex outermembrane receptor protein